MHQNDTKTNMKIRIGGSLYSHFYPEDGVNMLLRTLRTCHATWQHIPDESRHVFLAI
jgi:hypothetical protein